MAPAGLLQAAGRATGQARSQLKPTCRKRVRWAGLLLLVSAAHPQRRAGPTPSQTHRLEILLQHVPRWLHHFEHHVVLDVLHKIEHALPQRESPCKPREERGMSPRAAWWKQRVGVGGTEWPTGTRAAGSPLIRIVTACVLLRSSSLHSTRVPEMNAGAASLYIPHSIRPGKTPATNTPGSPPARPPKESAHSGTTELPGRCGSK